MIAINKLRTTQECQGFIDDLMPYKQHRKQHWKRRWKHDYLTK